MGRFESGKIFWKLLLPERQKKRVGKRQEGLKVEIILENTLSGDGEAEV